MDASHDPSALLSPSLHGILQQHVLPLLAMTDLAHLAASSSALRELIMSANARVWQQAAQAALPWHPPLPASIPAVQAEMIAHHTCSRNISRGGLDNTSVFCCEMQYTTWHVSPSDDGQYMAYISGLDQNSTRSLWLIHLPSSQQSKLFHKPGMEPVSCAWQQNGHLQMALRWQGQVHLCIFDVYGHHDQQPEIIGPLAPLTQSHHLAFHWSFTSCMALMDVDIDCLSHHFVLLNGTTGTCVSINKPAAWSAEQWADRELASASFSGSNAVIAVLYSSPFYSLHTDHILHFYECHSGALLTKVGSNEPIHTLLSQSRHFNAWHDDLIVWWLDRDSCFLISITSAASNKLDLGVLSLCDGSCRPLNCEFPSRHHTLAAFEDMLVSPDGQHAVITILTKQFGYELLFISLQTTGAAWSHSVRIGSHERCRLFVAKCWSPCSRWLAVSHDLFHSKDQVPQLQLVLVDASHDKGKQAHTACRAAMLLTNSSIQAAMKDCCRVDAKYWTLRWSSTGSSLRFAGTVSIDMQTLFSHQDFMIAVKATFI
ncbi:hypothetical protein MMC07_006575 [Pseudocyphellaria aurata]|nr:hypothetical protein [Pseudocyphellaria aurata]